MGLTHGKASSICLMFEGKPEDLFFEKHPHGTFQQNDLNNTVDGQNPAPPENMGSRYLEQGKLWKNLPLNLGASVKARGSEAAAV